MLGVESTIKSISAVLDNDFMAWNKLSVALRASKESEGLLVSFVHSEPGDLDIHVIDPSGEGMRSFNQMSDDYAFTNASDCSREWNQQNVEGFTEMRKARMVFLSGKYEGAGYSF